jgi:hypothetical protein
MNFVKQKVFSLEYMKGLQDQGIAWSNITASQSKYYI